MENNISSKIEWSTDTNYIHIIGKVTKEVTPSHLFDNKMHYFVKIEVDHKNSRKDIIHIFVPEDLIVTDNKIVDINDTIEVEGYLVHTKVDDRSDVSVIADDIKVVDSSTGHDNTMYLGCIISELYELKTIESPNGDKLTKNLIIKHNSSRHPGKYFTMKAVTWNSLSKKLDSDYNNGDSIIVKGRFRSKETLSKDKTKVINLHELLVNVLVNQVKE